METTKNVYSTAVTGVSGLKNYVSSSLGYGSSNENSNNQVNDNTQNQSNSNSNNVNNEDVVITEIKQNKSDIKNINKDF